MLLNLADVEAGPALAALLQQEPASVDAILKHVLACRHAPGEYTAAFARLLAEDGCQVATHAVFQSMRAREEAQERVRQGRLAVLRSSAKPSLTRLLEAKQQLEREQGARQLRTQPDDAFREFCQVL